MTSVDVKMLNYGFNLRYFNGRKTKTLSFTSTKLILFIWMSSFQWEKRFFTYPSDFLKSNEMFPPLKTQCPDKQHQLSGISLLG